MVPDAPHTRHHQGPHGLCQFVGLCQFELGSVSQFLGLCQFVGLCQFELGSVDQFCSAMSVCRAMSV